MEWCFFSSLDKSTQRRPTMDPTTLIIGALAAGAAAAAKDTASQAVKDAYAGLKALIQRRFAEKKLPTGEMVLTEYEEDPDVWKKPLESALVKTETHQAEEVLEAVEVLKQALEQTPEGREAVSKYILNIQNSEVGVIGDNATVEGGIHFGDVQKKFSVKADRIHNLTQAERIDTLNQKFGKDEEDD
jgi:hypothetical protein